MTLTDYQRAARGALAGEFGPAIIWTYLRFGGAIEVATDTEPCLRLRVDSDGCVTSPLGARRQLVACDTFDHERVDRAVRAMHDAVERGAALAVGDTIRYYKRTHDASCTTCAP